MDKAIKYPEILSSNIKAISAIMAPIRASIGPKGLDVMLVDEFGAFTCTNDGVEILSNIKIDHPVAKLAVEAAKSQETQVGDGTSTVAILCDSILQAALEKINLGASPNRIAEGIAIANTQILKELTASSIQIKDLKDPALKAISKISARGSEEIANLIAEAMNKSQDPNDLANSIIARCGLESKVIDGHFIKKKTHFKYSREFRNINLILVQGPMEPEPMSSEAINTNEGVKKYENNIQSLMEAAKKIIKAGTQAIICSASMFPAMEEFFAKEGVFVLTHVKDSDIKALEKISGAKLITRNQLISSDIETLKTLNSKLNSIILSEELGGFIFQGPKAQRASILISAETETILNERTRIVIDACKAMAAAAKSGYVLGEGIAELNIIPAIEKLKTQYQDEEIILGIEVMIKALSTVFDQIVLNAGFNPHELKNKLKSLGTGIDLSTGSSIDLIEQGILDPLTVKSSAFKIATEIASQILRINMIVQAR